MELREQLAALCHEQWSGWMEYLFSQCKEMENGDGEIPWNASARWQRQMRTPYSDLSEEEKESDRKEADRFLAILESQLKEANEKIKELTKPVQYHDVEQYYKDESIDDLIGGNS